jgi:hypothetical protein
MEGAPRLVVSRPLRSPTIHLGPSPGHLDIAKRRVKSSEAASDRHAIDPVISCNESGCSRAFACLDFTSFSIIVKPILSMPTSTPLWLQTAQKKRELRDGAILSYVDSHMVSAKVLSCGLRSRECIVTISSRCIPTVLASPTTLCTHL